MNTMLKFKCGDFAVRITAVQADGQKATIYVSNDFRARSFQENTDWDIESCIKLYVNPTNQIAHVAIYKMNTDSRGNISGHRFSAEIPVETFNRLMTEGGVYLDCGQFRKFPKIVVHESAQRLIVSLSPAERNALRKFLGRAFKWPGSRDVEIYKDWGADFFFEGGDISGGICRHAYMNKKGHYVTEYSIHT